MSFKWIGPIVDVSQGPGAPVNWKALLLRCAGSAVILFAVAFFSVFGPSLFVRGEPEDWQERTVAGLRFDAPAPLTQDRVDGIDRGGLLDFEHYSDGRKNLNVTATHLRTMLPILKVQESFESEEKRLRSAVETVAADVVCYPKEATISGKSACRFVCTGNRDGSGFFRIESLVVCDQMEKWTLSVRYQPAPFNGQEKAARRVLDSAALAAK